MTRAVLYLRLSSSVEDSTSIARQEADLRALAEREGWTVARILADDGISGRKARANAAEALRMLRAGEADVLAVWKLDRWSRQGLGAIGDLVATLEAAPGSTFVALQDGLRSDQTSWRLIAAVLSEVARTEADNTSTRARSAIDYRKRVTQRFTGGGTIPFGYASEAAEDGVGRVLVPDPAEASVVREVADRILDGEATTRIARDLTLREIPTSKSAYRRARYRGEETTGLDRGRWTVSTVRTLWSSHTLLGRTSLGADVVRDEDGLPVTSWPPLIELSTAEALRARLIRDPARAPARTRTARLLSGVIFCAYCDRKLYVTSSGGRAVYRCPASRNGHDCPSPTVDALNVERFVSERFLLSRGQDPEIDTVETVTSPETSGALVEVEAALREATGALLDDDADTVALVKRVNTLKARRAELRQTPSSTSVEYVRTGRTLRDAWDAAKDDDERRTRLVAALDHVTLATGRRTSPIDPERIAFFWHEGVNRDAEGGPDGLPE